MHACATCSSVLVQPTNWHEQGDGYWYVELRCPECEWTGRDSYSQSEVDRYDEELDRGGQELIEDLRSLTRANMEDEADRLALRAVERQHPPGRLLARINKRTIPPTGLPPC